jgi:hypothetical protein
MSCSLCRTISANGVNDRVKGCLRLAFLPGTTWAVQLGARSLRLHPSRPQNEGHVSQHCNVGEGNMVLRRSVAQTLGDVSTDTWEVM